MTHIVRLARAAGAVALLWLTSSCVADKPPTSAPAKQTPALSKYSPGHTLRDCPDCPEIVVIPAGSFQMGSVSDETVAEGNEEPRHTVTLAEPIGVGKFEITVEEFRRFIGSTGYRASAVCYTNPAGDGGVEDLAKFGYGWNRPGFHGYEQSDRNPVVCVTWRDAQAYAGWLSSQTGQTYRLLTEAEWEYAARGGSSTLYPWGAALRDACAFANGADRLAGELSWWKSEWPTTPCDDGALYTSRVGTFKANGFGLFDMIGNVTEWVQDCYENDYEDAPSDGAAVGGTCKYRVLRGGNWANSPNRLRSAARDWESPDFKRS